MAEISRDRLLFDNVDHVEIKVTWCQDGDSEGGALPKNAAGDTVKIPLSLSEYGKVDMEIRPLINQLRCEMNAGDVSDNVFEMIIPQDGDYTSRIYTDKNVDSEREAEIRESIGNEEYERLRNDQIGKSNRSEDIPHRDNKSATVNPDEMTAEDLLGFLFQEVSKDAPRPWFQIKVSAHVFYEDKRRAVSTVYSCYKKNSTPVQFSTSNVFGPMNAVLHLQQFMASRGDEWSKVDILFNSSGSVQIQILE